MTTKCPRCIATNGKAHSFEMIGYLRDGQTHIYYTSVADATEADDSPESVSYYLHHFEETKPHKWIWIFDCKGMQTKDLIKSGMSKKLSDTVQNTYHNTLLHVYIINPTMAIRALLTFLHPFLLKETRNKIHVCSLGLIDTINKLETAGVPGTEIKGITQKLLK